MQRFSAGLVMQTCAWDCRTTAYWGPGCALTSYVEPASGLRIEELEFRADDGPDGWVPLRIVSLPRGDSGEARQQPVVIFLHATGTRRAKRLRACAGAQDTAEHPLSEDHMSTAQTGRKRDAQTQASTCGSRLTNLDHVLGTTGRSKESMAERQEQYARAGYLTAAIDCRYHGDRAVPKAAGLASPPLDPRSAYQDSLVRCAVLSLMSA